MMGLHYVPPETRPDEVARQHGQARELVGEVERGERRLALEEVLSLAESLLRVTPDQLGLMAEVSGDKEPWGTYLRLAELVLARASKKELERDRWVFGLLDTGRRNVLQAAYLYVRAMEGDRESPTRMDGGRDGRVAVQLRAMIGYLRTGLETPEKRAPAGKKVPDVWSVAGGGKVDQVDEGDPYEDFT